MRILYFGDSGYNTGSAQRARALARLGHEVKHIDLESATLRSRFEVLFHYRTGYRFLQRRIEAWFRQNLAGQRADLVWVDSGALLGPKTVRWLAELGDKVVNYNCDDPTGTRDPGRWRSFCRAIPCYDALVAVRDESEREYHEFGARKVIRVFRSYDEVDLAPRQFSPEERASWSSDVVFIGTWMPERGSFLAGLLTRGVPLTLYGDRWSKAREWSALRGAWKGSSLEGVDYVRAIQCSKVALGLLSKGNRDLHTIRSTEVPYVGALYCAERTSEHLALYKEGHEAIFWDNAEECAVHCRELLVDEPRRARIAAAGRCKVLQLKLAHTDVIARILSELRTSSASA